MFRLTPLVAFGAVMMASSALNNIFLTYFLSALLGDGENDGHDGCAGRGRRAWLRGTPELTPGVFFVAQASYALWNAANDPLMGWLSDRCVFSTTSSSLSIVRCCCGRGDNNIRSNNILARRASAIRWGGLAWAGAFALAWFPPSLPAWLNSSYYRSWGAGLHYFFALSFYDTALSLVEVNHSAVLAELKGGESARARANAAAGVGAALGALTAFPAHMAWQADCAIDGEAHYGDEWAWPGPFRAFCVCLAVVAAFVLFTAAATLDAAATRAVNDEVDRPAPAQSVVVATRGAAAPRRAAAAAVQMPLSPRRIPHRSSPHFSTGDDDNNATASTNTYTKTKTKTSSSHNPLLPWPQVSYAIFIARAASLPAARTYMCIATLQAFDCALGKSFFASFLTVLASPPHSASGGALHEAPPLHALIPSPLSAAKVPIASFATSPAAGLPWLLSLFPHALTVTRASLFSDGALATVVAASFLLPHIFTVVTADGVAARGVGNILGNIFTARALLASTAGVATLAFAAAARVPVLRDVITGPSTLYIRTMAIIAYQLISRVSSEAVCRAMPLAKARLIDAALIADAERGANDSNASAITPLPLAAALGGAADFFPKIAASIAPLIGFSVVRLGSQSGWGGGGDSLSDAIWVTLIIVPAVVSFLQLYCGTGHLAKSLA